MFLEQPSIRFCYLHNEEHHHQRQSIEEYSQNTHFF